ncbi:hypothetical protein GCM10010412_029810 [Nonomuraea recticatena]|uniref:Uncharacterized protein n=1 Tax=Nonomuraea recticatena TaxID=46178 RepID=A0ABN3RQR3_9ACTN
MAVGWSPEGVISVTTSKGATFRCKSVTGRMFLTVGGGTDISDGEPPPCNARLLPPVYIGMEGTR